MSPDPYTILLRVSSESESDSESEFEHDIVLAVNTGIRNFCFSFTGNSRNSIHFNYNFLLFVM